MAQWLKTSLPNLNGRGVWGRMDTCIRMAELLRDSPETITALLSGYNPIKSLIKVSNEIKKNLSANAGDMASILGLGAATKPVRHGF